MKKIVFICLFATFIASTFAQEAKTGLQGKVIHKPWSKSGQSYCAQRSDYFVIQTKDKEFVLESQTKSPLEDFTNKKVILQGYFKEKEIKNNPMEQHPVSSPPVIEQKPVNSSPNAKVEDDVFSCTVFVVERINEADNSNETSIKVSDFCVKLVVFEESKQIFVIDLEYKGTFLNYPILQIEVDGKIVANPEAKFEFYGQTKGVSTHTISSKLKSKPKQFTVIVMSGMDRVPLRLSYPCKD